ncbi:MAG: cell division protein FtsZ [Candidatus Eremiobacterota bacterium]
MLDFNDFNQGADIRVIGVGGGGCNTITRMIDMGVQGVNFIALNTDIQSLNICKADIKLQMGVKLTNGLGTGSNPDLGEKAAEENKKDIEHLVEGADMVFIIAGMGGGTGTGASPVVADIAKSMDILTVGVVTKPFKFELSRKMKIADMGTDNLRSYVDTLITVPNQKLVEISKAKVTFKEAMAKADDVLRQAIQGITDLIIFPGEINVDFADIKTIMSNAGSALIGIGEATGDNKAQNAALMAISSPFLDAQISNAKRVLFNITGGEALTLEEIRIASEIISNSVDPQASAVIFGTALDESMEDEISITVIATGLDDY